MNFKYEKALFGTLHKASPPMDHRTGIRLYMPQKYGYNIRGGVDMHENDEKDVKIYIPKDSRGNGQSSPPLQSEQRP